MRKAIITGLITGIIISAILICGTYLRRFLPDTFTANLLFLIFFFGSIVTVLWLSFNHYCKTSAVRWKSLSITGIVSSIMAALLVSMHGYLYSRVSNRNYIEEIILLSRQKWEKTNTAAESVLGDWTWFQTPVRYAIDNFKELIVLLALISLVITVVFYLLNRKRHPHHLTHKNEELIF